MKALYEIKDANGKHLSYVPASSEARALQTAQKRDYRAVSAEFVWEIK